MGYAETLPRLTRWKVEDRAKAVGHRLVLDPKTQSFFRGVIPELTSCLENNPAIDDNHVIAFTGQASDVEVNFVITLAPNEKDELTVTNSVTVFVLPIGGVPIELVYDF